MDINQEKWENKMKKVMLLLVIVVGIVGTYASAEAKVQNGVIVTVEKNSDFNRLIKHFKVKDVSKHRECTIYLKFIGDKVNIIYSNNACPIKNGHVYIGNRRLNKYKLSHALYKEVYNFLSRTDPLYKSALKKSTQAKVFKDIRATVCEEWSNNGMDKKKAIYKAMDINYPRYLEIPPVMKYLNSKTIRQYCPSMMNSLLN